MEGSLPLECSEMTWASTAAMAERRDSGGADDGSRRGFDDCEGDRFNI
jgi:hypothetical protein